MGGLGKRRLHGGMGKGGERGLEKKLGVYGGICYGNEFWGGGCLIWKMEHVSPMPEFPRYVAFMIDLFD